MGWWDGGVVVVEGVLVLVLVLVLVVDYLPICIDLHSSGQALAHWATPFNAGNKQATVTVLPMWTCIPKPAVRPCVRPSAHPIITSSLKQKYKAASLGSNQGDEHALPNKQTTKQTDKNQQNPFPCREYHPHPTTAFMLRLSRNPPRSSFLTSTTQCSKLSIRTRAFVSPTTS